MSQQDWLARQFDDSRKHLKAVAYRILGSASEADDAIQETWLKLSGHDSSRVENLGGWLTTVLARVCLDMLRTRRRIRGTPTEAVAGIAESPEDEIALADATGLALLVVLDTLTPAERVAFVLHDMFDLSFEEIATIIARTPVATRQLATRARQRVRNVEAPTADLSRQRELVEAFLAASRDGDFERLMAVLSPDALLRADPLAVRIAEARQGEGAPALSSEMRGAARVAGTFKGRAAAALPAIIDDHAGAVWLSGGQVRAAFVFTIEDDKIKRIEIVMEPERLDQLEVIIR